jgi:hypothetical protein
MQRSLPPGFAEALVFNGCPQSCLMAETDMALEPVDPALFLAVVGTGFGERILITGLTLQQIETKALGLPTDNPRFICVWDVAGDREVEASISTKTEHKVKFGR